MHGAIESWWPATLATTALAAGIWLVVTGVARQFYRATRAMPAGTAKTLSFVRSIRRVLVGMALVGVASGMLFGVSWLVTLSLIIGGEELLESTVVAAALNDEVRRRAAGVSAHATA